MPFWIIDSFLLIVIGLVGDFLQNANISCLSNESPSAIFMAVNPLNEKAFVKERDEK